MRRLIELLKKPRARELGLLLVIVYFLQILNILLTIAMHGTLVVMVGQHAIHAIIDELCLVAGFASSIAAWLVIRRSTAEQYSAPMAIWIVLSLLTFSWIISLAMLSNTMVAFVFAIVLVIATVDTIVSFSHINRCAAYLMFPYLFWALTIATLTGLAFF